MALLFRIHDDCCFFFAFQEFVMHRAWLRVHYVSSYMLVLVLCFVGVALGELWNCKKASPSGEKCRGGAGDSNLALPCVYSVWRPEGRPAVTGEAVWVVLAALGAAAIVLTILGRRFGFPTSIRSSACRAGVDRRLRGAGDGSRHRRSVWATENPSRVEPLGAALRRPPSNA